MTLHIDFTNYWPLIVLAAVIMAPLALIYIWSITKSEVTRLGIAHKDTSFWLESKRSPRTKDAIRTEQPDPEIARRIS
jgi:hypothetical protein